MDKLTVTDMGKRLDGDYDCDLSEILINGGLLVSEAETVKAFCGARGYEVAQGFLENDWTVRAAVALIVLRRQGLSVTEETIRNAKVRAFSFEMESTPVEEDDDGDPTAATESGGESGSQTSEPGQESDPAPTGRLASVAS